MEPPTSTFPAAQLPAAQPITWRQELLRGQRLGRAAPGFMSTLGLIDPHPLILWVGTRQGSSILLQQGWKPIHSPQKTFCDSIERAHSLLTQLSSSKCKMGANPEQKLFEMCDECNIILSSSECLVLNSHPIKSKNSSLAKLEGP